MRLAFLGTPEAAVPSLRALVDAGHHVDIVITRPDRKRGRGGDLSPSPVKSCAVELGLDVGHRLSDLDGRDIERGVVVAYGRLIPGEVLARVPMLNVHFSLLPRWRGAAPVERAILAGDEVTGVSIMTLDVELDTGPVHLERRVAVDDKALTSLLAELADIGAEALVEVLASSALLEHPVKQRGAATYAEKISKEDRRLMPSLSVIELLRIVRLGGSYTTVGGRRLLIESATRFDGDVAQGSVALRGSQVVLGAARRRHGPRSGAPESGKSMSAVAWWAGSRLDETTAEWT